MKITVVGAGYVGLVTGACLAEMGNHVVCLDVVVARNVKAGRLAFTTDVARAVAHGTLQFIAVGTPPDEDGSADLSHVLNVARQIAGLMEADRTLIIKSTVPVGTADQVLDPGAAGLWRAGTAHHRSQPAAGVRSRADRNRQARRQVTSPYDRGRILAMRPLFS